MYDVQVVRKDFPILERQVHGRPLVYLDSAATSQKPQAVIDALADYYSRYNANVHRGIHTLAEEATAAYEDARRRVADFIGAASPRSVVFTRNTTEAINLVAYAWGRRTLRPGDEVVLTVMEHHSNLVPWQLMAQDTGAALRSVDITEDGCLDLEAFHKLLGPRTRLVALTHMSNVLGTVNPVVAMARAAHSYGALVLVDGAQSVPHLPVRVQELACDFLAFSGHKMLGPTGIGALYAREELLEAMEPFMGGGEMIREVQLERSTWNEVPWRFEAGTPNIADAIAWVAALDYLEALGMAPVRAHELEITAYALSRLQEVPGITIYGPRAAEDRGGVVAFNLKEVHPHDVGTALDQYGIAVRAGHHCAQPLHRRLGIGSTARASFYVYTTAQEIDALVAALHQTQEFFTRVAGRAGRPL
ncbi:MAG: cysteine desulfurase [Chloroflexi bacterium]|nr:cysteine desulfurase [Chloroflexota bacterium]